MGLLDELKRLTKPYDEDEDYFEEDLAEPVRAPQRQAEPNPYPYQEPQRPMEMPRQTPYRQPGQQQPPPQYRQPPQPQPQPRRSPYALSQPPAGMGYPPPQGGGMGYAQPVQTPPARVMLFKPERFEAAVEISERLQERNTVVLNLENTPKDVARRLVDFLSGVAFAMDGQVKKVSTYTCVITPSGTDVSGEGLEDVESRETYF